MTNKEDSVGVADSSSMKKYPSQATRTTPPVVENVAVGRVAGWAAGRVVGGERGAAAVVDGEDGAMVMTGRAVVGGPLTGGLGATGSLGAAVEVVRRTVLVVV